MVTKRVKKYEKMMTYQRTVSAKYHPVAWMSCTSKPRATFKWKKCPDSGIKSDKEDRSATSGNKHQD